MIRIIIIIFFAANVFADQCAVMSPRDSEYGNSDNPQQTAEMAASMINSAVELQEFCQPCGDTSSTTISKANATAEVWQHQYADPGQWIVKIGGKHVDIAYIYVDGENLALKSGCDASYVSATL